MLGRLADGACVIETFSELLSPVDFRGCLSKHLGFWQQRSRSGESAPGLWIISGAVPELLVELPFRQAAGWPAGVYLLGADVLRVGLVVVSELPRDPTTLLVRLMGGARSLIDAIPEVAALPEASPVRSIALPVLVEFERSLEGPSDLNAEEKEFLRVFKTCGVARSEERHTRAEVSRRLLSLQFMAMCQDWKDARDEARIEGRIEGVTHALRKQLVRKFGDLTPDIEARIAAASPEDLDRFLERILFADSLAAVFASDHS